MADNTVSFDLELVTKAFESSISSATKALDGFTKGFDKTTTESQKAFEGVGKAARDAGDKVAEGAKHGTDSWEVFKGALEAAGVIEGLALLGEGAKKLFEIFVVEGVDSAKKEEEALNKLSLVLKSTGQFSKETSEDFSKFADALEEITLVGSETTLNNLAVAKSFGLTNEQAKQVAVTAIGVAKTLGTDVNTAVIQLSETYNGHLGRLVQLNPLLKDLTEASLHHGDAVKLLSGDYAKLAVAQADNFAGASAQAKSSFENLQKAIGKAIIENPLLVDTVKEISAALKEAIGYVDDHKKAWIAFTQEALEDVKNGYKDVQEAIAEVSGFLQENEQIIKTVAVAVASGTAAYAAYQVALTLSTAAMLAYNVVMNAGAIVTGIVTAATTAFNIVLAASPLGIALIAVGALGAGLYLLATNWDFVKAKMIEFSATALQLVLPAITSILDSVSTIVGVFNDDLADAVDSAKETLEQSLTDLSRLSGEYQAKQIKEDQKLAADRRKIEQTASGTRVTDQTNTNTTLLAGENAQGNSLIASVTASSAEITDIKKKAKDKEQADTDEAALKALKKEAEFQQSRLNAAIQVNKKYLDEAVAREKAEADAANEEADRIHRAETSLTQAIYEEGNNRLKFTELNNKQKIASTQEALGQIATLTSSSNAELFEVGKAAAIAQATVSTYLAATKALAEVPEPYNFAAAALVATAGFVNVAHIAAIQRPSGGSFEEGGIVGGASFSGDRVTANVNSREGIFTLDQQKQLFNIANGKASGSNGDMSAVLNSIDRLTTSIAQQPVIVEVDGQAVAVAVRNQVKGGFALGGS